MVHVVVSFRSSENQITMHKCFVLLVFMVIILPSLGLSRYGYRNMHVTDHLSLTAMIITEIAYDPVLLL